MTHAEQWVKYINEKEGSEYSAYDANYVLMERYGNYLLQEFHHALFEFRNKILLNGGFSDFSILKKFDEHFKIVRIESGSTES